MGGDSYAIVVRPSSIGDCGLSRRWTMDDGRWTIARWTIHDHRDRRTRVKRIHRGTARCDRRPEDRRRDRRRDNPDRNARQARAADRARTNRNSCDVGNAPQRLDRDIARIERQREIFHFFEIDVSLAGHSSRCAVLPGMAGIGEDSAYPAASAKSTASRPCQLSCGNPMRATGLPACSARHTYTPRPTAAATSDRSGCAANAERPRPFGQQPRDVHGRKKIEHPENARDLKLQRKRHTRDHETATRRERA